MIMDELKRLLPAGWILLGILAWIAIPRELMGLPDALGDWVRLIPFSREMLPQLLGLLLILYGCWRLFELHVLPHFAHRLGPWKNDRLSMQAFFGLAGDRHGWDLNGSQQILDLIDGIGQAFADGSVQAYGRYNPRNRSNLTTIYLVAICTSHWRLHYIEGLSAFCSGDNVFAVSRQRNSSEKEREYVDIHLNKVQAHAWLVKDGGKWKGARDRRNQPCETQTSLSEIWE